MPVLPLDQIESLCTDAPWPCDETLVVRGAENDVKVTHLESRRGWLCC